MYSFASSFRSSIHTNISSVKLLEQKHENYSPKWRITIVSVGASRQRIPRSVCVAYSSAQTTPTAKKHKEPSFLGKTFKALDRMIDKLIPLRPSIDPRFVLSNNFAPVDELPPTECEVVEGHIPSCLNGAYIRNGPNPQFVPEGPYHLFDGDGMVHCLRISNGRATLCSRYVKTYKYELEHVAGTSVTPNYFSGTLGPLAFVARGVLTAFKIATGQYNPSNGIGPANTSLVYFGGRLYALGESDLPYELRITPEGDIETLGRQDFNGKLRENMTAHPKLDPETGETFVFRYSFRYPYLTYFWFNADGEKQPDVPIFSMHHISLIHDFAITSKYAIFPNIQLVVDPMRMIIHGDLPISFKPAQVARLGVIPRYSTTSSRLGEMSRWFDVPGFNVFHMINAWDERNEDGEEEIIVIAPILMSPEHALDNMELNHGLVQKVRINLVTGLVSQHPLSTRNLDFGVLNSKFVAKKNKYVYAGIGEKLPRIGGVAKLDISIAEHDRKECEVASRMYGVGSFGGEPFFVPRDDSALKNSAADEDDGYVLSFVHDENEGAGETRFVVMDAKSPSLDVVASVKLPQRVPSGFHGLFVKEKDLFP